VATTWVKLAAMDFSRLDRNRVLLGALGGSVLIISLLFLPWYSLSHIPTRPKNDLWICGTNDYSCTGFDTFPILRWLLLAAALAPLILAWIIVRGHKLSWAPGEMTMVVGFTAMVLIAYNGLIDKPGSGALEIGVGLSWGYWLALLSAIAIAVTGFLRSLASGGRKQRKAPGTV
jgi:hypothetical protein